MSANQKRIEFIKNRITELGNMLGEWEEKRDLAENPNERRRSEIEIKKIKSYLHEYQGELDGGNQVIEKEKVDFPDVQKIHKRWIIGILISLIILISGYFIYEEITAITPDYEAYLEYVNQGDKHVESKEFEAAETSYNKALAYNPQDSAVLKKLEFLNEAKQLIEDREYGEATSAFELILKIPASSSLTVEATNRLQRRKSIEEVPALTLKISMKDGIVQIMVSGGLPFENENRPYLLDGINCQDCVDWNKNSNGYTATISIENGAIDFLKIEVQDKLGNRETGEVSIPNSAPIDDENQEEGKEKEETLSPDELYEKSKQEADNYFKGKQYNKAIKSYEECLTYKANDKYSTDKINECRKLIKKEEEASLKRIAKVRVKGGTFLMGSDEGFSNEKPAKSIKIGNFSIGQTEVTVKQYKAFCRITGRSMPDAPPWGWNDNHPIVNVNWEDAKAFCEWVGGRLPTEAEWEFAANGGSKSKGNKYSGSNSVAKVAWYKENSKRTKPVKTKGANEVGVYDMTGNVAEWCADWYGRNYYKTGSSDNPKGPNSGSKRALRGGAYISDPNSRNDGDQLRITYRNSKIPNTRSPYIGFRVAWNS